MYKFKNQDKWIASAAVAALLLSSCDGHKSRRHTDSGYDEETSVENASTGSRDKAFHPLDLKFYLERSGSMIAFDANSTKGDFKKSVAQMLNSFPYTAENDSTAIYIVNDGVYPFKGNIKDFLSKRDFFKSTEGIGNPSYTDFTKIFEMIFENQQEYTVSVLVSDLIYSVKGQETVNPQKLLAEAKSLTANVFKSHPNGGVWIVKFIGDYNGSYYPYNSPAKGISYSGDRSYYAMVFASNKGVETLCEDPTYKEFYHFSALPGYQDMFFFTSDKYDPAYSVLRKGFGKKGEYHKDREEKGSIHSIKDLKATHGEPICIPVAVDLSSVPMSSSYKTDIFNYTVASEADFEIESIQPIDGNADASVKEYCPGATHIILLETDEKPRNETITITMNYRLPRWITQSSSSDDSDIHSDTFSHTTFAFEAMMQGIFNAYVPAGTTATLFTLPIKIQK